VVVTGEIDASTAGQLRGELYGLSRPGTNVVLDFASVTFIDAAGLGVLVSAARQARGADGTVTVVQPQPRVRRALDVVGLDRLVRCPDMSGFDRDSSVCGPPSPSAA